MYHAVLSCAIAGCVTVCQAVPCHARQCQAVGTAGLRLPAQCEMNQGGWHGRVSHILHCCVGQVVESVPQLCWQVPRGQGKAQGQQWGAAGPPTLLQHPQPWGERVVVPEEEPSKERG